MILWISFLYFGNLFIVLRAFRSSPYQVSFCVALSASDIRTAQSHRICLGEKFILLFGVPRNDRIFITTLFESHKFIMKTFFFLTSPTKDDFFYEYLNWKINTLFC